jgi:SNF2 family DNA or RNA helicase
LKTSSVIAWVRDFLESERKLILFAVHKSVVTRLREAFPAAVEVVGATSLKQRKLNVERFLGDADCPLLIGNVKAAGTGWSAPGVSDVAFAELAWSPGTHTQAEDRCHGLGRGKEGVRSTAFYLVARGTLEEKLVKLLQEKQRVASRILDGGRGDPLDVFDRLVAELRKEKR